MVENHKEILEGFFKHYPKENECVITSDGQIFERKAAIWAQRHADHNGLKIKIIKRSELDVEVDTSQKVDTSKETPAAPAIEAPNLKRMKKAELIDFAKENEISIDEQATNAEIAETIQTFLDTPFNPDSIQNETDETADSGAEKADDSEEHKPTKS